MPLEDWGGVIRLINRARPRRSERHAGAAAHRPGGEVLAAKAADFAADQDSGAARDSVSETGSGPRRPAVHELGRQQQHGVVAREVIVAVEPDIGCERRPVSQTIG